MRLPVQITFREIAANPALEAYVLDRVKKLDRFHASIMRCHVVVDAPHRHHRQGTRYEVRIDLTVPGGELAISRNPSDLAHTDVHACIDAAFDDARRLLDEHQQRRRSEQRHRARRRDGAA